MLLRRLMMVAGVMLCLCAGCGCEDKPAVIPDKDEPKEEPETVSKTAPRPELQIIKSVDVWCFPEYYRIDPVTGDVAEFGFKPVTDAFRQKNDVYDAATNTVSLAAMKGETVPFQILVEGDHSGVTMEPHAAHL